MSYRGAWVLMKDAPANQAHLTLGYGTATEDRPPPCAYECNFRCILKTTQPEVQQELLIGADSRAPATTGRRRGEVRSTTLRTRQVNRACAAKQGETKVSVMHA